MLLQTRTLELFTNITELLHAQKFVILYYLNDRSFIVKFKQTITFKSILEYNPLSGQPYPVRFISKFSGTYRANLFFREHKGMEPTLVFVSHKNS